MRSLAALLCLTLLTACGFGSSSPTAVDAVNLPPLSSREQALMIGAESDVRSGNVAAAEQNYLGAIAESHGHVEAHIALAKVYIAQGQPDNARAILNKALEWQPNSPGVNYLLGKLDLARGDNEAALADFNRGLTTVPGDFDLSNGAAIASDMLGRHQAAQSIYLELIAHHKQENLDGVRTNLGMSYLFTNEPKNAIATLKKVTVKPDASPVTRTNLALAYALQGKTMESKLARRGVGDDESFNATLARLKAYIADTNPDKAPVNVNPIVTAQKPGADD